MNLNGMFSTTVDGNKKPLVVKIQKTLFNDCIVMLPSLKDDDNPILKGIKWCLEDCKEAIMNDGKIILCDEKRDSKEISTFVEFDKWVRNLQQLGGCIF